MSELAKTTNGNGRMHLVPWLIGTVTTALLGVGTGTINTVHSNTNRISVLEAHIAEHRVQLDHIEKKLDRLLDYYRQGELHGNR